jgi:CysZ protein
LLKEILIAIQAFFKIHRLVLKKQRVWLWLAGIGYCGLFIAGIYFFYETATKFTDFLITKTNIKNWLQSGNAVVQFFFITGLIMFHWVLLIYYFGIFKYLYQLLFAPVCSYLSVKTDALLHPVAGTTNRKNIGALTKHALLTTLKNFFWQTLYTIVFLVVSLIPIIGWIVPIIALLHECYYAGYANLDYKLFRKKYAVNDIQQYINRHKGLAIGNGLLFYAIHSIPLLGWIAAPVYAIAAANIAIDEFEQ